jgi:hypothetical protein
MRIAFPTRGPVVPRRRPAAAVVLLALFLSIQAPASADVGQTIINRCTHGQSLSGFSQQDYRRALQELPTEVEEYSACGNLIRRAQLAAAGGSGGGEPQGPAGTAPIPVTAAERNALNQAPKVAAVPVQVGDETIRPGVIHANVASALSSLPNSLLAVLAFLLACALLLGGRAIRNRVHGLRSR